MKLVSFNINSVRAHMHQLEAVICAHAPDVIGLQETKVTDEDFPVQHIQNLGYHSIYHGQKTHYGVALLTKTAAIKSCKGFAYDTPDSQRRLVVATLILPSGKQLDVLNGYFPQGENRDHPTKFGAKEKFYQDLIAYIKTTYSADNDFVVMGDVNISAQDCDIGIGDKNAKRWLQTGKCSFLPEERQWWQNLLDCGLTDSYRQLYPEARELSWFDYRSRGFEDNPKRGLRIDQILVSNNLVAACQDAGIDYAVRGLNKPSDHAPIWLDLDVC